MKLDRINKIYRMMPDWSNEDLVGIRAHWTQRFSSDCAFSFWFVGSEFALDFDSRTEIDQ